MLEVEAKNLGNVTVLSLQGQIVNGETAVLCDSVHCVSGVGAVRLDFARVTTIDAGGLGVMLELREQVESRGIRFELMNVTKQVSRVLEIARLDTVFRITSGVVEFFPTARNRQTSAVHLASCA